MDEVIIQALEAASSQNILHVKQSEAQLKEWETNRGFYPKVLDVFLMKNLDINIRWLAIIYLKNGINKYWRKTVQNCMTEEEKTYIRGRITVFDEQVPELALQLAVVIGRIARCDIRCWPQGLHLTLEAIRSENEIAKHRALLTLNQIAKELASKRLVSDRRVFQEISSNVFSFLQQLCYHYYSNIKSAEYDEETILKSLELCILVSKVLRKLLIYGATGYSAGTDQMNYIQWCVVQIQELYQYHASCRNQRLKNKVDKLLLLHMKILTEFDEHHSASILPILLDTTKICLHFVLTNTNSTTFPMLVIYCGNLLRSVSRRYSKLEKSPETQQSQIVSNAKKIISDILTEDCVRRLAHHLVMGYFPLTNDEMEEWSNDPEGYVLVEAGESHKFLLRPCMETLFVGLFYEFKQFLIPFILNLVQEVNTCDLHTAGQEDILKISAIFKAVGLASYELFGDIDFDGWFIEALLPLFHLSSQSAFIVQQHVVWLIGEWINIKFSKSNRVELYKLISAILSSTNTDLVLKLTTCKTLRIALDDIDFVLEDFHPFVNDIFVSLCQLLMQCEQCDTKMVVLNVVSIMIERVGNQVHQNADMLLQHLPQLWQLSEAHNLLRGAVVNVLNHLTKGLGAESSKIDHITIPIIHHSTCVDQPAHIYLLEEGLELWHSVVKNTRVMTQDVLGLYKNMFALLERASESLEECLAITRSYLLINAAAFIQEHSGKLSETFTGLSGNIKESAAILIVKVLKLVAQLQPSLFVERFQNNVLNVFECCVKDENYPPLMTQYLTTIAYMVVHRPENLYQVGQVYSQLQNNAYEDVMGRFFDVWLDKTDCMSLQDKKLSAIALVSILPHKTRFVGNRFALVLDVCVNVVYDLQNAQAVDPDDQSRNDSLCVDWLNVTFDSDDESGTVEDIKERKLLSQDPVYTINLLHFLRDKLNETKITYGEQLFNEAMETMDSAVAKQLLSLISPS